MQTWKDEAFSLFLSGRLGDVGAERLRDAIDTIEASPRKRRLLEELHGAERRLALQRMVRDALDALAKGV